MSHFRAMLLFTMLCLVGPWLHGQDSAVDAERIVKIWQEQLEKANKLTALGKYQEALVAAKESKHALDRMNPLMTAEDKKDPDLIRAQAVTFMTLGKCLSQTGDIVKAEPNFTKALDLIEPVGPDELLLLSMNSLSMLYVSKGDFLAAENLLNKAKEITIREHGQKSLEMALNDANLAMVYFNQGKLNEAESLHRKSIAIKKQLAPSTPSVAISLLNLANVLNKKAEYVEAEGLIREALKIHKDVYGSRHVESAKALNNLAQNLQEQGDYPQAEKLFKESLEIKQSVMASSNPSIAIAFNNLAALYKIQYKFELAEKYFRDAYEIYTTRLGANHPQVISLLSNLALVLSDQGKFNESAKLHRQAITILEKNLSPNDVMQSRFWSNYATTLIQQGKYNQAKSLLDKSLALLKNELRPDHPDVATVLVNLSGLRRLSGACAQAQQLSRQALDILESNMGQDHPSLIIPLCNLADDYRCQNEDTESVNLLSRALRISNAKLDSNHPLSYRIKINFISFRKQLEKDQLFEGVSTNQFRVWTDVSGKHKRTAKLVQMDGVKLVVQNENGKKLSVPLNKLSQEDKDFCLLALCKNPTATPDAINQILETGAKVNARDQFGLTPLIASALLSSDPDVLEALLDAGADQSARDKAGLKAIDYARKNQELIESEVMVKLSQ